MHARDRAGRRRARWTLVVGGRRSEGVRPALDTRQQADALAVSSRAVGVEHLSKAFPHADRDLVALQDVSLDLQPGEFTCIVGASGSGKSTLLNVLAGLETASSGRFEVQGRVALMFQEAALFPWLTASQNVELALKLRGVNKRSERRRLAHDLLERVHLHGFERRRPHELSGGMKQRVALARALAQDADVLLMDEPFGSVDAITRDLLHEELLRLWRASSLTILFVTHNAREAVRLGDRVLVFTSRPGRVAQEFEIDLPRPRSLDSPELAVVAGRITERLKQEMRPDGH